jgi:putative membrane protein
MADGLNDPGTGDPGTGGPGTGGPGSGDDKEPDVRFSYANERTFLAWIRTSLGLVTAGLAITQLLPPFHLAGGRKLIGLPLIALGVVVALYSFRNWQENERAMRVGRALPRSILPQLSAVVVSIVAVIGLALVIWGGPSR